MPWVALLVAGPTLANGQTSQSAGTLPEDYLPELKPILETALRQAPEVLLSAIDLERREAAVLDADHQRWPNVGGDIRYDTNQTGISGNSGVRSRQSGLFYSVSANQAVFHWGEIKHQGDIARITVAIGKKNYAEAYRMLAVDLRSRYLDLIAGSARLRQARYDLELKQKDLASVKERLAHGSASTAEVIAREQTVNNTQLDLDRQQADFDSKLRRFCRLAGITGLSPDRIPVAIPQPRYDAGLADELEKGLMSDGAKSTIPAQIASLEIKKADLNYRIARVRLLPKFDASLGHSRESSTTATPGEVSQTAITRDTLELRGNWNIFDGFATKAAKLAAKADERYWQRQRSMTIDGAMDQAQQLRRALDLDARSMQFTQDHEAAQAALLKRQEEDLKVGRISARSVEDTRRDLRASQANTALTRAEFLSDWSAFVSLTAEDPVLNQLPPSYVRAN